MICRLSQEHGRFAVSKFGRIVIREEEVITERSPATYRRLSSLRRTVDWTVHDTDGAQKETRAPNRHWRDWFGPTVEVMKPKFAPVTSDAGLAKFAWLVAFNASARN